mmetsp:Transcript_13792/g.37376  ORF Transcript_13792/g.37376 Transcript_13792/m.37376 type:complete len:490 (-) Transcript_13792:89-1558(-)
MVPAVLTANAVSAVGLWVLGAVACAVCTDDVAEFPIHGQLTAQLPVLSAAPFSEATCTPIGEQVLLQRDGYLSQRVAPSRSSDPTLLGVSSISPTPSEGATAPEELLRQGGPSASKKLLTLHRPPVHRVLLQLFRRQQKIVPRYMFGVLALLFPAVFGVVCWGTNLDSVSHDAEGAWCQQQQLQPRQSQLNFQQPQQPLKLHKQQPQQQPQQQQLPTMPDLGGQKDGSRLIFGLADGPWSAYPVGSNVSCPPLSVRSLPSRHRLDVPASSDDVCCRDALLPAANASRQCPESTPQQDCFCPGLVVPDAMEFVFAIREVLAKVPQQLSFSIVDMSGHPLCHAIVNELGGAINGESCGIHMQYLDKEPLAQIHTEMLHAQPGSLPVICRANGETFCELTRDQRFGTTRRYVLRDRSGDQLVAFHGDFREKAVNATDPSGRILCVTQRCTINRDNAPHASYYEVRVAPGADAGLLLCGLLAIDKVEGVAYST